MQAPKWALPYNILQSEPVTGGAVPVKNADMEGPSARPGRIGAFAGAVFDEILGSLRSGMIPIKGYNMEGPIFGQLWQVVLSLQ